MKRETMTPRDIKYALDKAGYSQVMVADACRVSQTMVNLVIHKKTTSHKVRCFIAGIIGREVEEVFEVKANPTKPGRPLTRLQPHAA